MGVTVSTVVFNRVTLHDSSDQLPTLASYHSAQWTNFTSGVLGKFLVFSM